MMPLMLSLFSVRSTGIRRTQSNRMKNQTRTHTHAHVRERAVRRRAARGAHHILFHIETPARPDRAHHHTITSPLLCAHSSRRRRRSSRHRRRRRELNISRGSQHAHKYTHTHVQSLVHTYTRTHIHIHSFTMYRLCSGVYITARRRTDATRASEMKLGVIGTRRASRTGVRRTVSGS